MIIHGETFYTTPIFAVSDECSERACATHATHLSPRPSARRAWIAAHVGLTYQEEEQWLDDHERTSNTNEKK